MEEKKKKRRRRKKNRKRGGKKRKKRRKKKRREEMERSGLGSIAAANFCWKCWGRGGSLDVIASKPAGDNVVGFSG